MSVLDLLQDLLPKIVGHLDYKSCVLLSIACGRSGEPGVLPLIEEAELEVDQHGSNVALQLSGMRRLTVKDGYLLDMRALMGMKNLQELRVRREGFDPKDSLR